MPSRDSVKPCKMAFAGRSISSLLGTEESDSAERALRLITSQVGA